MGEIKNLQADEALDKMRSIAEDVKTCLFCTRGLGVLFETRPMVTQEIDDEGNFWFVSNKTSQKNEEIKQDDLVQLIYADATAAIYMVINGHADVFYDREKIEQYWNPLMKTWFRDGIDDPNLSIIRVKAENAYYWDAKAGEMVSFLKIMTGAGANDGIEGRLDV